VNGDHLLNFIAISHKVQGFLIRVAVEGTNHGFFACGAKILALSQVLAVASRPAADTGPCPVAECSTH